MQSLRKALGGRKEEHKEQHCMKMGHLQHTHPAAGVPQDKVLSLKLKTTGLLAVAVGSPSKQVAAESRGAR